MLPETMSAKTLRRAAMSRKARFRAALGLARVASASEWARQHKVTPGHLSQVLDGKRESQRLTASIDAFISEHLGEERVA